MLHFLFPSHPLDPGAIDDLFVDQRRAIEGRGFTASLFPESVIADGQVSDLGGWTAERFAEVWSVVEPAQPSPSQALMLRQP